MDVGNDFAKVKLEELVKESNVRSECNGASDIADDRGEIWLWDSLFSLSWTRFLSCCYWWRGLVVVGLCGREGWRPLSIGRVSSGSE